VNVVSVLSPGKQPAERCAEILSCRPAEQRSSPAAVPTTSTRAVAGEPITTTARRFGMSSSASSATGVTDANQEQAFLDANRRPLDRLYDEHVAAQRATSGPQVLIRPGIGQVLALGGVPVA
jgi:hypothetical protein